MNETLNTYRQHTLFENDIFFLNAHWNFPLDQHLTMIQYLLNYILDKAIEAASRRYQRDEISFPHPATTGNRFTR